MLIFNHRQCWQSLSLTSHSLSSKWLFGEFRILLTAFYHREVAAHLVNLFSHLDRSAFDFLFIWRHCRLQGINPANQGCAILACQVVWMHTKLLPSLVSLSREASWWVLKASYPKTRREGGGWIWKVPHWGAQIKPTLESSDANTKACLANVWVCTCIEGGRQCSSSTLSASASDNPTDSYERRQ